MLTDISASSNVVYITFGGDASDKIGITQLTPVTYSFNSEGTILSLIVNNTEYQIDFSGLTIGGSPPATVADAYTALSTVFPAAGGGGGNTIYTGDGTLAGDRTVTLGGHLLHIAQGGDDFLVIDPTPNAENSYLYSFNSTTAFKSGYVGSEMTATTADMYIGASVEGSGEASINAHAESGNIALLYTADTHEFNGNFLSGGNISWDINGNTLTFSGGNVGIGATPTADKLFLVNDGSNNLLYFDISTFITEITASDNIGGSAGLELDGDSGGGSVSFNLQAQNGATDVSVTGDAVANTLTFTAATVNISSLAGTGSRAVVADASGNLSAP